MSNRALFAFLINQKQRRSSSKRGAVFILFKFIEMSEQELQLAKLINKEEEVKKQVAWGKFGVQLYHSELRLQLIANEISKKLITPDKPEQIPLAEQALATVKKELKQLIENRISVTTARFDPVIKRLMLPEKSLLEDVQKNEAAILKAKLKEAEDLKTQANKDKELKDVAEKVRIYVADMHAALLEAHLNLISTSYKHAIEHKITVEQLPEFIAKVKRRLTITNCTTPPPKPVATFNTQDVVDAEVLKLFNPWPAQKYIDGFSVDIDNKFSDWGLALKNPDIAISLDKKEVEETTEAIKDEKESVVIEAKLETIAAPVAETTIKPLKEIYQIPDPATMDQAHTIINAYTVNKKLCFPHVRKITPINFGVKQMKEALERVKNDDNNFSFTGLVFTLIKKL